MRESAPLRCPECGRPVTSGEGVVIDGGHYHRECDVRIRRGGARDIGPVRAQAGPFLGSFVFRHLLDAEPDEELRIVGIHFEPVRERCEEMGLEVGARLTLGERTRRSVRVVLAGGREVDVETHLAQLIEVQPAGPARPPFEPT